ncbi:MAG: thioredoxin domain-containing protein [Deltaproteobacteria bacterium]|nr:thioredoxin domain-containing protein [Deltaproteobacteria bacterium]
MRSIHGLARAALVALVALATGCAGAARSGPEATTATHAAHAEGAPREELPWATFSPETFARAARERKYIVLDGSAEWCHWCHVMEATTYHDPAVRKILDERFIAVKVDVDSRPDIEERYGDWGWPATVLFSPDATEIGKYRGYIAPEKFTEILKEVVASGIAEKGAQAVDAATAKAPRTALSEEHLAWIQHATDVELDDYWDETEGGWGRTQKAPLGYDNAWMLWRASQGDATAKQKAIFSLDQQSKLIDPVWGGIYQYSAARHWGEPHFEKLMTFQAPALDNYARAYQLTGEPRHLARAKAMLGYLDRFMKGPEGGFYTTQDADVNAHDRTKPFVNGHDYYTLDEKSRLARGLPRIDTHEYGRENGLAIAAYATMFEVTKDPAVLASAEKAARRVLATHGTPRGGITHDRIDAEGKQAKQLFLADNASFGLGLARLYEVTKSAEHLQVARAIGDFMIAELTDDDGGGMFAATKDPDAVGVFAKRRVPFEENVAAVRMYARLARASGPSDARRYGVAIDRILRAISTPEEIKGRGRMLGDYLLALEESKGVRGVAK